MAKKATFPKGVSGNPAGRPKGVAEWDERVREMLGVALEAPVTLEGGHTLPALQLIISEAVSRAAGGDKDARKWIFDRLAGAPPQRTEVGGANGGAIELRVISQVPRPVRGPVKKPNGHA